eukprot:1137663-Pelagomonas_calceolata.AAC.9
MQRDACRWPKVLGIFLGLQVHRKMKQLTNGKLDVLASWSTEPVFACMQACKHSRHAAKLRASAFSAAENA